MTSIEENNAAKPERKFESISDFFQYATEAQKREPFCLSRIMLTQFSGFNSRAYFEYYLGSCTL